MSRAIEIIDQLAKDFPDAHCELKFSTDFELLVAVILSAQCTDKRVNIVTSELFKKYNTPLAFATMEQEKLESLIHSCGFFRAKAKNIISASRDILQRFNGKVPSTMDELLSLGGVGRKTANVVLSVAFGEQTIAVDTHVFRTSRRLGLSDKSTPEGVEQDLVEALPEDKRSSAHHLLIFHGRYRCHSRNPDCELCTLTDYCKYIKYGKDI
ncbi:MAG: endonuclease III [Clostridia bacterium]|nr:endonuclease III [Clostridia bacterium]